MKIAMQGVSGAFHEIAIRKYFKKQQYAVVACGTFNELFDTLQDGRANYAMMAIENSLVGSILPNYTLLRESGLRILGEVNLRIEQHLLGVPGMTIEKIKKIYSHPMAIQQCNEFLTPLRRKGVIMVDSEDTALSAKRISQEGLKKHAAIASRLAAKLYHLDILAESIETNKNNYTRFLILSNEENYQNHKAGQHINKSSLYFLLPHEQGKLSEVLSVLTFYKINLTKIQSLPIAERKWEYLFYIDLEFDDYNKYKKALEAVQPLISELKILGEYQKGETTYEN